MKKLIAKILLVAALAATPATAQTDFPSVLEWREMEDSICEKLHWKPVDILAGTEDSAYLAPTQEDIDALLKFYRWRREGLGYLSEAWDCDNFAREFKHWADVWSVHYYDRAPVAVAVGMAYVKISGDVSDIFPSVGHKQIPIFYHVLNVIRRADGQWLFFEPQTGALVPVESMLYEGSIEVLKVNL